MFDFESAKAKVYAEYQAAWNRVCEAVLDDVRPALFDRVVYDDQPENGHWCRITLVETDSNADGFTASVVNDKKAYRSEGMTYVQIFSPLKPASMTKEHDAITSAMRSELRKMNLSDVDGCRIILRRIRILQIQPDESMLSTNVVAEFEFRQTE
jgi:hypothetical protein